MSEKQRVAEKSGWYLKDALAFDRRLVEFRFRTLAPYLKGPSGLELGSAEGIMTRKLLPSLEHLTVVEGSAELLRQLPDDARLVKHNCLFEDFEPAGRFDSIILEHVLEHVADPVRLLTRARGWLRDGGRVLLGVPNALSLHRLAAVKMGLLETPWSLNERDIAVGHRRVYTPATLRRDVELAGLTVKALEGVFLKPLSNAQIDAQWTVEMLEGFYQLGRDFPEHSSDLFIMAEAAEQP